MESITSGRTIITHNDESPLNFNNDLIIKQTIKRLSNQALKIRKTHHISYLKLDTMRLFKYETIYWIFIK